MNPSPSQPYRRRAPKMQDIADQLSLSVATVSRAVRRLPGIRPETRARVMRAASEVGYSIPEIVTPLGHGEAPLRHVGVFLETEDVRAPSPYLTGMSEACTTLNASLMVHYVKPKECEWILEPGRAPRLMTSGALSGIVLVHSWPWKVVDGLSKIFPTVSIVHRYSGIDIDVVGIDNEGGMSLVMQELHAGGHRKIGFFGRCGRLYWANARFGGYVGALAGLGLSYNARHVIDVGFDPLTNLSSAWDDYAERIEELVRVEGVTAVVCASEPAGWELHRQLTARGVRVPEDVSITGFHRPNVTWSRQPDLTSVGASYEAIGAAALRRLLFRIENDVDPSRTILFPCEFYRGSSVGCARQAVPNET